MIYPFSFYDSTVSFRLYSCKFFPMLKQISLHISRHTPKREIKCVCIKPLFAFTFTAHRGSGVSFTSDESAHTSYSLSKRVDVCLFANNFLHNLLIHSRHVLHCYLYLFAFKFKLQLSVYEYIV